MRGLRSGSELPGGADLVGTVGRDVRGGAVKVANNLPVAKKRSKSGQHVAVVEPHDWEIRSPLGHVVADGLTETEGWSRFRDVAWGCTLVRDGRVMAAKPLFDTEPGFRIVRS